MRRLKPYELEFLAILRKNGREQLSTASRAIGMPISTLYDRLQRNKKTLIKKFTALLDYPQLGFHTRVTMIFKARREKRDVLRHYLVTHPNVNSVYKINNGYDFLIDTIFVNIREVEEFIAALEDEHGVRNIITYYLIEEIIEESFLSDKHSLEQLFRNQSSLSR